MWTYLAITSILALFIESPLISLVEIFLFRPPHPTPTSNKNVKKGRKLFILRPFFLFDVKFFVFDGGPVYIFAQTSKENKLPNLWSTRFIPKTINEIIKFWGVFFLAVGAIRLDFVTIFKTVRRKTVTVNQTATPKSKNIFPRRHIYSFKTIFENDS